MSGELPNPDSIEQRSGLEEIYPPPTSNPQETITEVLQRDIQGAEFLLALLWSAMSSFRHDSILRPFPGMFLEGEGGAEAAERLERAEQKKDIEGLVRCNVYLCKGIPHPLLIEKAKLELPILWQLFQALGLHYIHYSVRARVCARVCACLHA